MSVIPFPDRSGRATPRLELLSYVFAALSTVGEPASAGELSDVITEHLGRERSAEIRTQVSDILDYYSRTWLPAPVDARVFRRIGDEFAYTVEFRTHLALQGVATRLRPLPSLAPSSQVPPAEDAAAPRSKQR